MILVVGLFVLYFLLTSPTEAADVVRAVTDLTMDAFGQVAVFLAEFF